MYLRAGSCCILVAVAISLGTAQEPRPSVRGVVVARSGAEAQVKYDARTSGTPKVGDAVEFLSPTGARVAAGSIDEAEDGIAFVRVIEGQVALDMAAIIRLGAAPTGARAPVAAPGPGASSPPVDVSAVTRVRWQEAFVTFAGLTHGDGERQVRERYGPPDGVRRSSLGVSWFYPMPDGTDFYVYFESGLVRSLTVELASVPWLRARGIVDPNLDLLGQHRRIWEARFGPPNSVNGPFLSWEGVGQPGKVLVVRAACDDERTGTCKGVNVMWRY